MNTNPKYFQPPKMLWISKGFEFYFPLSSESYRAHMVSSNMEIFSSGEHQFIFIQKGFRRSSIVAVGEIIPTGEKSCMVVGRAGVESYIVILLLLIFVLLVPAIWSSLLHQQFEQFLQLNLASLMIIASQTLFDWGMIFSFVSMLKHINGRDIK